MRSGAENEDAQFMPGEDQVKDWTDNLSPVSEFDQKEDTKIFGFYTKASLEFIFIKLYSEFAKNHIKVLKHEEVTESDISMHESDWSMTYTYSEENEDEPEEFRVTVEARSVGQNAHYISIDTDEDDEPMPRFLEFARNLVKKNGPLDMFKDQRDEMEESDEEEEESEDQ